MSLTVPDVDVCLCTYQRPQVVNALRSIDAMTGLGQVRVRIIVADNDVVPSAKTLIADVASTMNLPVHYIHAPSRNISLARNACLDVATARWVAWVDDDEIVAKDWLKALLSAAESGNLDAVFGPALAQYPENTKPAMIANDFHSNHVPRRNGIIITGHTCNALVKRNCKAFAHIRFDLGLGRIGGEDTDYFFKLYLAGARMDLSDAAKVDEVVDHRRLRLRWIMKRHFNAGVGFGSNVRRHKATKSITALGRWHGVKAPMKLVFCAIMSLVSFAMPTKRLKWFMRGIMHAGVIVGIMNFKGVEQY